MSIGRRWLLPVVVGLVGALVVGIAWWVDHRGRVDVGLVDTSAQVRNGTSHNTSFSVPGGTVQVSVEIGDETDDEKTRAPRDGRLARVTWSGSQSRPESQLESLREEPKSSTLRVRSEDRLIQVTDDVRLEPSDTAADDDRTGATIALPGSGRHLVVELEFAGRRQSVALATGERVLGSFASLYRPTQVTRSTGPDLAGRQSRGGLEWYVTPSVVWERRPYVEGLGWAKPGKEWLVLGPTSLRVSDITRPSTSEDESQYRYEPDGWSEGRGRLTVEDGRAVRKPSTDLAPGRDSEPVYEAGGAVFEIGRGAATALRMTVSMPVRPEDSEAPAGDARIVATRTVPIDAVPEPGAKR